MKAKKIAIESNEKLNIKGGVLLIGSLLWQDYVKKNDNTIRMDWRDNNLGLSSKVVVKVPIRYGRKSGINTKVFTMTFSNSCRGKNIGLGFVIPFSRNPLTNFEQLRTEARECAIAEGMDNTFIAKNNNGVWCVLGLLINKKKTSSADKTALENFWQEQLMNDSYYADFNYMNFKLGREQPSILQNGLLNIPWPVALNKYDRKEVDSYDFVIATATLPTGVRYPSFKTLARNVILDTDRKYFLNNYKSGIITFQDVGICNKIDKQLKTRGA